MSDTLAQHLRQMHDSALALLEGRAGPLTGEQCDLARIICAHAEAMPGEIDRLKELIDNCSTPEVCIELLCDLNNLLTPIVHCAELIEDGAAGRVTRKQREATQVILKATEMIQAWTISKISSVVNV